MTDESMAITIGKANQEIEDWAFDYEETPNEPNEIGSTPGGFNYILGARAFYANSLSVSLDMAAEVNRKAGNIDPDQMYKQTDPLRCKIDVEYYISNNHYQGSGFKDPYLFMRDDIVGGNGSGESFFPITIGKNIYNKCFLESLTIDIKPFAPVSCRASFSSTSPPSGELLEGVHTAQRDERTNNYLMNSDNFVYGHNCQLSGWITNLTDVNSVYQLNFSRNYGRKDIYCLGEQTPRKSLVKTIENKMVIKSTGFKEIISPQGIRTSGDISVIMRDCSGIRPQTIPTVLSSYDIDGAMTMASGSYVTSQRYSIAGGDALATEMTISQGIL
jgi:hypothetical protein